MTTVSRALSSDSPKTKIVATEDDNPLDVHDYFGVHKLFSIQDLFKARVHLGHTVRSLGGY